LDTNVVLIRIKCVNDKNGNPRRGWISIETLPDGDRLKIFHDEGYSGYGALPPRMRSPLQPESATLRVNVGTYNRLKKGIFHV
jgi:hypothetical protein